MLNIVEQSLMLYSDLGRLNIDCEMCENVWKVIRCHSCSNKLLWLLMFKNCSMFRLYRVQIINSSASSLHNFESVCLTLSDDFTSNSLLDVKPNFNVQASLYSFEIVFVICDVGHSMNRPAMLCFIPLQGFRLHLINNIRVSNYHRGRTRTDESARKAFYYRKLISRQVRIFNPVIVS